MLEASNDIHLLLGRLDGKMDMVLSNQTAQTYRLDRLEKTHNDVTQRLTSVESSHKASKKTTHYWLSYMFSAAALLLTSISSIKGFMFK